MTENNRTSHRPNRKSNPTLRGLLESPRASCRRTSRRSSIWRGVAGDRGGAFQFHGEENARAAGCRQRAAAATHVAGQHRQQRAGLEEPAPGRTREGAAGGNGRRCRARSSACVCDARATGRRRGLSAQAARRPLRAVRPALPAKPAAKGHAAATYSGAATGAAHCGEGARTGRRIPLRFQSGLLPCCRATATAAAAPKSDDACPV